MSNKTLKMAVLAGVISVALCSSWSAKAGELTAKQTTSCQAIMCLAAVGSAPSECMPALRAYYSIDASSAGRLRTKRKNFLNLCPSGTPDLVNSLVRGQCNSVYQNCTPPAGGGGKDDGGSVEARAE